MGVIEKIDRGLLLYLGIGLIQGFCLYYLFEIETGSGEWTTRDFALLVFTLIAPTSFFLASSPNTRLSALAFAIGIGALAYFLHVAAVSLSGDIGENVTARITALLGGSAVAYIFVCYFRAQQEDGNLFNYAALFKHAWNLPFIGAMAGAFLGAFWLVLLLWAALFDLIDIDFFEDLFTEEAFAWPASCATLAIGVYIARDWERVILTLRGVAIALLRFLAPILVLVSFIFIATLGATGLEKLWQATSATITTTSLVVFALLFINAVIGGESDPENAPNAFIAWSGRAQSFILPAFAAIALYSLWLRADQYGWTVPRIYGGLFVFTGGLYSASYFLSSLMPQWTKLIQKANIAISLFACALVVLVQTPILNPYAISTNSLMERLDKGRTSIEEFDFGYLRFHLGDPGRAALTNLREDTSRAAHSEILERIETMEGFETYWEWERFLNEGHQPGGKIIDVILGQELRIRPIGHDLDPAFLAHLKSITLEWDNCKMDDEGGRPCYFLAVDIIGDETEEYLWFTYNAEHENTIIRPYSWNEKSGTWTEFGVHHAYDSSTPTREVWRALEQDAFGTFNLEIRGLRVGGEDFIFNYWNLPDLIPKEEEHSVESSDSDPG